MQGFYQQQQPASTRQQPPDPTRQESDPIRGALGRGFLFGMIMLSIYIIYYVVNYITGYPARYIALQKIPTQYVVYVIPGMLGVVAALVFFICGISAARKTGRGGSGWVAGHFASLIYGFGALLFFEVFYFLVTYPMSNTANTSTIWSLLLSSSNNQLTSTFLSGLIAGNLAGTLGGLLGRGRKRK